MQKFGCRASYCARGTLIKYLLMTKIVLLLLFACSLQCFAKSYGQQSISLRLERVQLKKVFKAIEDQGYFRFVYKDDILPREQVVSIVVRNATIDDVRGKVLAGTPLAYHKLSDNLIVITRGAVREVQAD